MSTERSTTESSGRKTTRRWAILALVGVSVLVAGSLAVRHFFPRPGPPAASALAAFPVSAAVLKAGAGKVGDLLVTQEAMELAEITIAPADTRTVTAELPVSGVIEAGGDREAKVTPRVPGRIVSVSAVVGDDVRAGQTLATIESMELARAQAAYRQARARAELAAENLARQRELAKLGAFGGPRVEEARKDQAGLEGEQPPRRGKSASRRRRWRRRAVREPPSKARSPAPKARWPPPRARRPAPRVR